MSAPTSPRWPAIRWSVSAPERKHSSTWPAPSRCSTPSGSRYSDGSTDEFPAFYLRTSGLGVSRRIESADEAAAALEASIELGLPQGILVTPPIPEADALDADRVWAVVDQAQRDADASGLRGAPVTPFVLDRIATATEGESIPANLALARHNAEVAAQIAVAWCALG